MKNIKFISALALTLMLASCDDFDLPNPPGQTNPEPEAVFENSGIALQPEATTINLKEANNNNVYVNMAKVTELVNFPAEYTLSVDMEVYGEDVAKAATVGTVITDDVVTVNPDLFNGAIQEAITRQPGTLDVNVRYVAYAERGTTRIRLGGLDTFYAPTTYQVTTLDPATIIEDAYYLVGDFCNWDLKRAIKMNNTQGEGVSPYDNPEFAIKIDVTEEAVQAGGLKWKVVPASSVAADQWTGGMGCNPADATGMSGILINSPEKETLAGVIKLVGPMLVTINVEDRTYRVNYALEVLYPFSGSVKPENMMLLYTDNYINYQGVTAINNVWYLCGQPDKNGAIRFYQDPEVEPEISESGFDQTGLMTTDSSTGKRLTAPVRGNTLYWVEVNLVQQTYSLKGIKTLSVIGSGNGWDLATATPLTPSKDLRVWTADNVTVGDNFKINANGAWDVDFGGVSVPDVTGKQVYNINYKGGNLQATPGTYKVTVDFSTTPYVVTLE